MLVGYFNWFVMQSELFTHTLAALAGFLSSAGLLLLRRRRTGAINSTRVLAFFFLSNLKALDDSDEGPEKRQLKAQIERWLEYPNSLGSEANAAKLVAMVQLSCEPSGAEIREADRALNALDQRATERERSREA